MDEFRGLDTRIDDITQNDISRLNRYKKALLELESWKRDTPFKLIDYTKGSKKAFEPFADLNKIGCLFFLLLINSQALNKDLCLA